MPESHLEYSVGAGGVFSSPKRFMEWVTLYLDSGGVVDVEGWAHLPRHTPVGWIMGCRTLRQGQDLKTQQVWDVCLRAVCRVVASLGTLCWGQGVPLWGTYGPQ